MDTIHARFHLGRQGFTFDVDICLPGRGVTAIFGRSGSGKTTLVRCVAGLEQVRGGFLSVNNEIWQDETTFLPTHRRPLGYVFQEASLFPHLTVLGNLKSGRKRVGKRVVENQEVSLDHSIELLGIGHLLDRKPDRLSGGESQRVSIARALAVSPRILLMDEPLAALDLDRKQEILPYLERLHDELQIPILYITHSPDEVARLADHLVVMESGRVMAAGPLVETLARLDLPIRLGEDVGVVLEGIVLERDERWHLTKVGFSGGSLWITDQGVPLDRRVRVRILARDVSLATECGENSSILNLLHGRVDAVVDDDHPGSSLVRVLVGDSAIVARVTKRSAAALGISPGQLIWVQVKSVALIK